MKKSLPYLLGALGLIALAIILIGSARLQPRKMNERLSLRTKDKIPYGFYAAYHLLPELFTHASVSLDKSQMLRWDDIQTDSGNQAVVMVCTYFDPEEYELRQLANFVKRGNHVFIIAASLSEQANKYFGLSSSFIDDDEGFKNEDNDSLGVQLAVPPFTSDQKYLYSGKRISYTTALHDSSKGLVLGSNNAGHPNFLYFKAGEGIITIHLSPLAFSNYFILHKNNIEYYQQAMSVIPQSVDRIVWNEYYLFRKSKNDEPSILKVLFRYPSFKWALLTAGTTILLFALLYMRRRQRMVPLINKPKNESLDFVKTIGRLYYDKEDHTNLAKKMAAYFLDHVRQRYLLATHTLNDDFVATLHAKSAYDKEELATIVTFINYLKNGAAVNEYQLARFHKQLETFYQNS
ncbi:MAG: hypothetical protein C4329_10650 [Chitinophagaceae bacterium]